MRSLVSADADEAAMPFGKPIHLLRRQPDRFCSFQTVSFDCAKPFALLLRVLGIDGGDEVFPETCANGFRVRRMPKFAGNEASKLAPAGCFVGRFRHLRRDFLAAGI